MHNFLAQVATREKLALLTIFCAAFLLRLGFDLVAVGLDSPATYDGVRYDAFAVRILAGQGYSTDLGPTASKPPLYPFFVAGVYGLFGHSEFGVLRLVQALLDSFTCVLVYLLGKSLGGTALAFFTAVGAVLYPLSIYMASQFTPETLFLLLFVAMLFLVVKMVKDGRGRWFSMAAGVLSGLCLLARPNSVLFLPFVLVYPFLVVTWRAALRLAFWFLAFTLLVLLPWGMRNWLVFHEFVPLTTEGGGVFWADNNPLAGGATVIPSKQTWPEDDYPDLAWSGWSALGEPDSSRRFLQAGVAWIRAHPLDFLALIPSKLARLWSPASFTTHSGRQAASWTVLLWIPYAPFLVLVALGMAACWRRWKGWWLLYGAVISTTLSAAIFAGGTRYSVPMVPSLLLFSAAGLLLVASTAQRALSARVDR